MDGVVFMENWKDIKGYEGIFQISSLGRVRSLPKLTRNRHGEYMTKVKIIKGWVKEAGYVCVTLKVDGVKRHFRVHRLVAEAFIPNPLNKKQVNHIDGNKSNNQENNLEWVTAKENIAHAFETGLNKPIREKKPVLMLDRETGKVLREFDSVREVYGILGIQPSNIVKVIKGKRNHTGGYNWKYKESEE
ncbi:NUMOD4 domain-containing protein [Bacillus cereus]|uniref:NUMOD4 domain-containing protein n=1 Tax=Bacillus cereus TaxID=1396 RepID=UPI003555CE66